MVLYTEKQLETAWKNYFKTCSKYDIKPLNLEQFRPVYENICEAALKDFE